MISPYVSSHYSNTYDKIKVAFFILSGIAIVRFILFFSLFLLANILIYFCLLGYSTKNPDGNYVNFSVTRRFFIYIPQIILRISLIFLGFYWFDENIGFNIFNFNYLERESSPKLLIFNHISFIDSLYLFCRGFPSGVTSYNNLNLPIVGSIVKKMEPILVPTNDEQRKLVPDAKTQINNRLTHPSIDTFRRPLVIFPEGVTKNGKYLFKFQQGAFMNDIEYQPILLKYDFTYFDPSWTFDNSSYKCMFFLCCQFVNTLKVEYLPPCKSSIENIRKVYLDKLKLIDCNLSNHDNHFLYSHRDKIDYIYQYIYEKGEYNITHYRNLTKLKNNEISKIVNLFYSLDILKEGSIIFDEIVIDKIKNALNLDKVLTTKEKVTFNKFIHLLYVN